MTSPDTPDLTPPDGTRVPAARSFGVHRDHLSPLVTAAMVVGGAGFVVFGAAGASATGQRHTAAVVVGAIGMCVALALGAYGVHVTRLRRAERFVVGPGGFTHRTAHAELTVPWACVVGLYGYPVVVTVDGAVPTPHGLPRAAPPAVHGPGAPPWPAPRTGWVVVLDDGVGRIVVPADVDEVDDLVRLVTTHAGLGA